ncbi:MAG: bifunctional DNA-formamidopyrimidine glycosylase/DNA-(apurinic or apyrimidinic site) lyase [Candidatus Thorarchaeota archaeon]
MPEGPEVETVRKELSPLISRTVKRIRLTEFSQNYPKYRQKQPEFDIFVNSTLDDIIRIGKFLIWRFVEVPNVILNHLGMSGRWGLIDGAVVPERDYKHPKVLVEMKNPPHAVFDDTRNFGQFRVFKSLEMVNNYSPIKKMGIDGLAQPFPTQRFADQLDLRSFIAKPIGEALIDQRLVAGIGNIYKSEALFEARIDPRKKVQDLSKNEKNRLGEAISFILNKALRSMGSSIDVQPYTRPNGDFGEAQIWHRVYNRAGKSCPVCNKKIERIKQKGRSTFFCAQCQK